MQLSNATLVIVLLLTLSGSMDRHFLPLGSAFSASTLSSRLASVTVMPAPSLHLLLRIHGDMPILGWLRA